MGKLTEQAKLSLTRVAMRDALRGLNVLIVAGSSRDVADLFDFMAGTLEAEHMIVRPAERRLMANNGGRLTIAVVRNMRDLERLKGQGVDAFVSFKVQQRFLDYLIPWFTQSARRVETLAGF